MKLRCECGTLQGVAKVHPRRTTRVVCYCDDCQCCAHHLGKAEEVLDEHGGTDILQVAPCDIQLTQGADQLACFRLSPKGTFRWYAACCNTPVANTAANPKVPFVGIVHTFCDHGEAGRDAELGPPRARIQARFAHGNPAGGHLKAPLSFVFRTARILAWGALTGRSTPTPFFPEGEPAVPPTVLDRETRTSLREIVAV